VLSCRIFVELQIILPILLQSAMQILSRRSPPQLQQSIHNSLGRNKKREFRIQYMQRSVDRRSSSSSVGPPYVSRDLVITFVTNSCGRFPCCHPRRCKGWFLRCMQELERCAFGRRQTGGRQSPTLNSSSFPLHLEVRVAVCLRSCPSIRLSAEDMPCSQLT